MLRHGAEDPEVSASAGRRPRGAAGENHVRSALMQDDSRALPVPNCFCKVYCQFLCCKCGRWHVADYASARVLATEEPRGIWSPEVEGHKKLRAPGPGTSGDLNLQLLAWTTVPSKGAVRSQMSLPLVTKDELHVSDQDSRARACDDLGHIPDLRLGIAAISLNGCVRNVSILR